MCCVVFGCCAVFAHIVLCECVDLVGGLKSTHQHIHLHTFQFTHFISSPFSQITFPFPTQRISIDIARHNENGEWEKCVELLEVRGEGGHVCGGWDLIV